MRRPPRARARRQHCDPGAGWETVLAVSSRRLFDRPVQAPLREQPAEAPPAASDTARILALQRSAGNAAVARLVAGGLAWPARTGTRRRRAGATAWPPTWTRA